MGDITNPNTTAPDLAARASMETVRAELAAALAEVRATLRRAQSAERAKQPGRAGLSIIGSVLFLYWWSAGGTSLLSAGFLVLLGFIAFDVYRIVHWRENRDRLNVYMRWSIRLDVAEISVGAQAEGNPSSSGPLETLLAALPEIPEWQRRATVGRSTGKVTEYGMGTGSAFLRWAAILIFILVGGQITESLIRYQQPLATIAISVGATALACVAWWLACRFFDKRYLAGERATIERLNRRAAEISKLIEETLGGP